MRRAHRLFTVAWSMLAAGAGLGFVARDVFGLRPGFVALAWGAGALAGLAATVWRCEEGRSAAGSARPPCGRPPGASDRPPAPSNRSPV